MLLSDNLWLDIALVAATMVGWLAFALALVCVLRLRKQAQLTQKLFRRLERNLQVANSSAIGMGKRLIALEQLGITQAPVLSKDAIVKTGSPDFAETLQEAQAPVRDQGHPVTVSRDDGLRDANNLLQAGIKPEEVARRCGISKAEASLLQLMNHQSPSAA